MWIWSNFVPSKQYHRWVQQGVTGCIHLMSIQPPFSYNNGAKRLLHWASRNLCPWVRCDQVTFLFGLSRVPSHHLKRRRGAPVMITCNVVHRKIVHWQMFVAKAPTRTVANTALVHSSSEEFERPSLLWIEFQNQYNITRVKRKRFCMWKAFAETIPNNTGRHWHWARSYFICVLTCFLLYSSALNFLASKDVLTLGSFTIKIVL